MERLQTHQVVFKKLLQKWSYYLYCNRLRQELGSSNSTIEVKCKVILKMRRLLFLTGGTSKKWYVSAQNQVI
jgi:hypothetical protein